MTQSNRILKAMKAGSQTSTEIASAIGSRRRNVSVALHRLANLGLIERAGIVNTPRIGRPCVRWRARRSSASPVSTRESQFVSRKISAVSA